MNILIIGSGSREHAIGWHLAQSPKVSKLFFTPGNAGTITLGENLVMNLGKPSECITLAKSKKIDMVIIGPGLFLQRGVSDIFSAASIKVFGPSKRAAEIEYSKVFSKKLLTQLGIPTPIFEIFNDYASALFFLRKHSFPVVIKTDGIARGRGVAIVHNFIEGENFLNDIFISKKFGNDGRRIIIEQFIEGFEISSHAFCDGNTAIMMPFSQDHKRFYDGDKGPNTAGLGAVCPVSNLPDNFAKEILTKVILPIMKALKEQGKSFLGVMYPGIILTKTGWYVLEINARFGDPEAQCYMRLLDTDLYEIIEACIDGNLNNMEVKWKNKAACCLVLTTFGYANNTYKKGGVICGLEKFTSPLHTILFYGETKMIDGQVVTNGSRIMGISSVGENLKEAVQYAYQGIRPIEFDDMYFRKDIGVKALIKNSL
ncbi:MAG: phosphoribosylamine--glycine ligase [Patescibacteria group bacterium]